MTINVETLCLDMKRHWKEHGGLISNRWNPSWCIHISDLIILLGSFHPESIPASLLSIAAIWIITATTTTTTSATFLTVCRKHLVCARSIAHLCLILWPHGLFCLWNFPGENIRVDCHFLLLQGIFLTQGSNLHLLNWQGSNIESSVRAEDSLPLSQQGSPPTPTPQTWS